MGASLVVTYIASFNGVGQILTESGTASFPFLVGSHASSQNSHCCNDFQFCLEGVGLKHTSRFYKLLKIYSYPIVSHMNTPACDDDSHKCTALFYVMCQAWFLLCSAINVC